MQKIFMQKIFMQKISTQKIFIPLFTSALLLSSALPVFAHDEDGHQSSINNIFPKLIPVPNGFQPEGVVKGKGHKVYVGSLKTGGIYEADLVSGKGELLVDQAPGAAIGLAYDKRTDYLFVAGGPAGTVTVYDTGDQRHEKDRHKKGRQKAVFTVAGSGSLINDGIVTRKAAFFTDSYAPVIYRIPLTRSGRLPDPKDIETISLTGDFEFIPGEFNGNGIESAWNGNELYLVNSATGHLYKVDPKTGHAALLPITNGDVINGDGMLLRGNKLYVVQNFLNQIAELTLADDGASATISRIITDEEFRIPTTVTAFGKALYAINARFDVAPPPFPGNPPADPELEYNLVRVEIGD